MTGIYNRTYFDEVVISLDHPEHLPLSVIVGDVNGMKLVNDAFGHTKGDMLLREIANILEQCVRKGDIVARTGGDEFSILMPNADEQAVKGVVDRIRAMCEEKRREEHNDIYIDIALGYATKSEPSDSLDRAMILAEDLMYRRKLLVQKSLRSDYLSYIKTTMFEKSNETEEHDSSFWMFSEGGLKFFALERNENVCLAIYDPYDGFGKLDGMQVTGMPALSVTTEQTTQGF